MLHLILSMTLLAEPGIDTVTVKEQETAACTDTARARHLCHTAYQLWDLTQRLDRELSVCKLQKHALDTKLQTVTSSAVMHTKVVEVERKLTPLEQTFEYVGAASIFLLGLGAGYLLFH